MEPRGLAGEDFLETLVVIDVLANLLGLCLRHVGGHCQVAEHLAARVAHDSLLVGV